MATVYYQDAALNEFVENYSDYIQIECMKILRYIPYITDTFFSALTVPAVFISKETPTLKGAIWNPEAEHIVNKFENPELQKWVKERNTDRINKYMRDNHELFKEFGVFPDNLFEEIRIPKLGQYDYKNHLITLFPNNFLDNPDTIHGFSPEPGGFGFLYYKRQSEEEIKTILSKILAHEMLHAAQNYLNRLRCKKYNSSIITAIEIVMESTADFFSFLWLTTVESALPKHSKMAEDTLRAVKTEKANLVNFWNNYEETDWSYCGAKHFIPYDSNEPLLDNINLTKSLKDFQKIMHMFKDRKCETEHILDALRAL